MSHSRDVCRGSRLLDGAADRVLLLQKVAEHIWARPFRVEYMP